MIGYILIALMIFTLTCAIGKAMRDPDQHDDFEDGTISRKGRDQLG